LSFSKDVKKIGHTLNVGPKNYIFAAVILSFTQSMGRCVRLPSLAPPMQK